MHKSKVAFFLFSLLLIPLLLVDVRAQAVYGSISGTVTDAQGAVVPEATVTITSLERNTSDTATTNDSGLYAIGNDTSEWSAGGCRGRCWRELA